MTSPDPTTDGAAAPPDPVVSALAAVTGSLAGGGEERPGQVTMAQAVAKAIADAVRLGKPPSLTRTHRVVCGGLALTLMATIGAPLAYNRPDPYLPDLLVCRPEFADQLLAALAGDARG